MAGGTRAIGEVVRPSSGRAAIRRLALLAGVVVVAWLAACDDSASDADLASPSRDEAGYAVLDLPGWELQSAIDYVEDPDFGEEADWWAEYRRNVPGTEPGTGELLLVRLSGHAVSVATMADLFGGYGFELEPTTVAGIDGLVGPGPDGPIVALWPIGDDETLMVLSYDLDAGELLDVADTARLVTTPEWIEAGGEILPCLPGTPDCDHVMDLDE